MYRHADFCHWAIYEELGQSCAWWPQGTPLVTWWKQDFNMKSHHENIERHTAHTIVSWPNPKQWVIVHTSDLMMIIRLSIYIVSRSLYHCPIFINIHDIAHNVLIVIGITVMNNPKTKKVYLIIITVSLWSKDTYFTFTWAILYVANIKQPITALVTMAEPCPAIRPIGDHCHFLLGSKWINQTGPITASSPNFRFMAWISNYMITSLYGM